MSLYVNCTTCVFNQIPITKKPCKPCEYFSEWKPKFTAEQMKVSKEEAYEDK